MLNVILWVKCLEAVRLKIIQNNEKLREIVYILETNHNGPMEEVKKRIIYYYSIRCIMSKYHTKCPRCKVKFLNPWQECDDCISKFYPET